MNSIYDFNIDFPEHMARDNNSRCLKRRYVLLTVLGADS